MSKVELLAPAGDLEKLKIAFHFGADAVYCAGHLFGLRANAKNFSEEEIKVGTKIAHSLGKKIYITVNIIFHEQELNTLDDYLKSLAEIGVDAIIASDIAVIKRVQELKLPLEVHLSTQASVLNKEAAKFYKDLGVSRIVLAREASLEDIKSVKETNLELECFVHGAMCTSFSGRCVLSNYCTNRDSNRGGCAQVCRFIFTCDDEEIPFTMSSKDLNLIEYISSLINAGINSFKVEGRMRGIYYIATLMYVYRKIIDKIASNTLSIGESKYYLDILNRVANRESAPQFINKLPNKDSQYFLTRDEESNQDFLGIVLEYDKKTKIAKIEQRNYFKVGDIVEFFGPNIEEFTYEIKKITNIDNENITICNHPRMLLFLKVNKTLQPYDIMRKKMFDKNNYL